MSSCATSSSAERSRTGGLSAGATSGSTGPPCAESRRPRRRRAARETRAVRRSSRRWRTRGERAGRCRCAPRRRQARESTCPRTWPSRPRLAQPSASRTNRRAPERRTHPGRPGARARRTLEALGPRAETALAIDLVARHIARVPPVQIHDERLHGVVLRGRRQDRHHRRSVRTRERTSRPQARPAIR